jgi:hypothetical protein
LDAKFAVECPNPQNSLLISLLAGDPQVCKHRRDADAGSEVLEHKHFRSTLADRQEAVEFLVRVSGPIPPRALAPALFVGDVEVFESEAMGDNVYRFLALDPARLKRGAAIGWGWLNTSRRERKSTRFRFEPEQ